MNTLEDRRTIAQAGFIFEVFTGSISSPILLENLNIRVRRRATRNLSLLREYRF